MAYAEEILPVDSYKDIENIEAECIENAETDYEIVTDGYSNNENVGSAAFTIQGKGQYCGTKVVKFSIVQRIFIWWKDLVD